MARWTVEIFPYNILELGTVVVTGTPDTGYPEARLFDRAISLYWKDTVTEAKNFTVDQSAAPLDVDFLAIEKHNFNGEDMQWQWSTDNFSGSIEDAVTDWTQGDNLQIIKTMGTELNRDYWRVTLSSMVNPQCSEIYMSKGYSFNALRRGNPTGQDIDNVSWHRTLGGIERSTKWGNKRRLRTYTFWLDETEWADFQAVIAYLDEYSKPFYFKDHEGNYFLARFESQPSFNFNHNVYTGVSVRIIEEL